MSRIRADLLRDICIDMSYHPRSKWIEAATLNRMFDLCEQFEAELSKAIQSDKYVRDCYGNILSRISNIAGHVVNPNMLIRATSNTGLRAEAVADTNITSQFSSRFNEDKYTSTGGIKAAPDDLIKVVVKRLPRLEGRAKPFLFDNGTYAEREPFVECFRDILGSVYWLKRDDILEDGYWPTPRTDAEAAALSEVRNSLVERVKPGVTSEDTAVICSLMVATTYAA